MTQKKLLKGGYSSPEKFAADVRLVWKNAQTYNRSDSGIYITADTLSKLFEKKFAKIKKGGAPAAAAATSSAPGSANAKRSVLKMYRIFGVVGGVRDS